MHELRQQIGAYSQGHRCIVDITVTRRTARGKLCYSRLSIDSDQLYMTDINKFIVT